MDDKEIMSAYLAGCFDGDGSFSITRRDGSVSHRSPEYKPLIQLGSLCEDLMGFFVENIGGSFCATHIKLGKDRIFKKTFYRWALNGQQNCLKFAQSLVPYLAIKRERVLFLIDFITKFPFKRGSNLLSKEVIAEKQSYYLKMRNMNDERYETSLAKQTSTLSDDPKFFAYFAGIMDTDGSFSIKKEIWNPEFKNPRYSALMLLSMQDLRAINKIRRECPYGSVCVVKSKTTKRGYSYRINFSRKDDLKVLLTKIIPYLRIKQDQAKILLEFCSHESESKYYRAGLSSEELIFREDCYQKVCAFNQYGVSKLSLIDLELPERDNKAEGESHRDRLSEKDVISVCDSQDTSIAH